MRADGFAYSRIINRFWIKSGTLRESTGSDEQTARNPRANAPAEDFFCSSATRLGNRDNGANDLILAFCSITYHREIALRLLSYLTSLHNHISSPLKLNNDRRVIQPLVSLPRGWRNRPP